VKKADKVSKVQKRLPFNPYCCGV